MAAELTDDLPAALETEIEHSAQTLPRPGGREVSEERAYPPAPWHMHGSLWLSAFRLREDADERHPAGTYGVALVSYEEPSPLTYHESARRPDDEERGRQGRGHHHRHLGGLPRLAGRRPRAVGDPQAGCATSTPRAAYRGPVTSTDWTATVDRRPIVSASFTDASRAALRVPFTGLVEQPGIPEHPEVADVTMKGSAKALPCRSRWDFASDGPLAFLRGARRLGSFRMAAFRLAFD
ncbi:hypothetical protein G5V59_07640 [Nocardioides sp. W3-2-3]|uniref:hypothetical protein n=1 Tax=Nocardioides convexus TaxID=2712224 RepID=UPI0024184CB8|nr:hypothetical protein [Nocardioides convexus]NHA00091.1 hypothetical protein [Nocardioides convexus]